MTEAELKPDKVYFLHCVVCKHESAQLRIWNDPDHDYLMTLTCAECHTVEVY